MDEVYIYTYKITMNAIDRLKFDNANWFYSSSFLSFQPDSKQSDRYV